MPVKTRVDLYVLGLDWSPTSRLTVSDDLVYRDDLTARNNTQILRVLADYIINRNIDVYSQIGIEQNHGGAAESFTATEPFPSWGPATRTRASSPS